MGGDSVDSNQELKASVTCGDYIAGNQVLSQMRSKYSSNEYLDYHERVNSLLDTTDKLMQAIYVVFNQNSKAIPSSSSSNELEIIYLKELISKLFHELKFVQQLHQDKSKCELLLMTKKSEMYK